ncbi:MAG: hypothetical protein ACKO7R_09095, partial [Pseudanabaena sp.]
HCSDQNAPVLGLLHVIDVVLDVRTILQQEPFESHFISAWALLVKQLKAIEDKDKTAIEFSSNFIKIYKIYQEL